MSLSGLKVATTGAGFNKLNLSAGIPNGKKTPADSNQVGNLTSSSSGKDKGNSAGKGTVNSEYTYNMVENPDPLA